MRRLVSVHDPSLRVTADLSLSGWADGTATGVAAGRTALLQSQKLLGTECLIVDLACCLDEVLEVGTSEEVPQRDELAMSLIFDIDYAPAVLPTTDLFSIDDNGLFTTNNSEGNNVLYRRTW